MSLQFVFAIYCLIFGGILIGAGIYSKRWVSEASDFILAGRELSLPINVMGVAAIGFAGTTVSLAPGFSLLYGVKASLMWGITYSVFGLMIYGILFSNFVRRCGAQTLPEYLEMRFNRGVRNVVSYGTIIGMCGILANNIVSLTGIVSSFVGWPSHYVMAVTFLIIIIFATLSGLWASTINDFIQVIVGTVAIPLLLILLINKFGGIEFIANNWPQAQDSSAWFNQGMTGNTINTLSLTYPSVLNFFLLFGAALVWGNNYYWGKLAASRNEGVAKRAFILAGIILILVFMIPLAFVGGYIGAAHPEIFTLGGGKVPPVAAYGVAAKLFAPIVSSFIIIGSVAASISTSSTSAMGATSTATRDIYQRQINPNASAKQSLKASKVIMFLVLLFTWLLCYFPGGPTYLFAFSNAWLVPPAVLLCLGIIWPRFNAKAATWGVGVGIVTMIIFTLLELTGTFVISQYLHLAVLGFVVTIVISVLITLATQKDSKYYGKPDWEIEPTETNRQAIELDAFDESVLELIGLGHLYMSDITDGLGVDSKQSNEAIEKLDRGGYIKRGGLRASAFYTFTLTDKGKALLDQKGLLQGDLVDQGLTPKYLDFLKAVNTSEKAVKAFVKEHDLRSLQVSSMVSHLVRRGYLLEKGMYKRRLVMTDLGRQIIQTQS